MQTSSKRALAAAVVILAGLIGYRLLFPPMPADLAQIQNTIRAAADAIQNRNINGVMAAISDHYTDDNGLNASTLNMFLVRAMRNAQAVNVAVSPADIIINGDTATSACYASVSANTAAGPWTRSRQLVKLTWKKERVNRYYVIPALEWRITSASYGSVDLE